MMTPELYKAIRDQFGLVDNAMRARDWQTAVWMLYCLGGMITATEIMVGFDTLETAPLRNAYKAKWDEVTALQKADNRRMAMWEDAC